MKIDSHNEPNIIETSTYYYLHIRYSMAEKASKLGAVWCVYERKWRIKKDHPNAPIVLSLAGHTLLFNRQTGGNI